MFKPKFVLCGSYKNPETDLIITANICNGKACGECMGVDMRHRVIARASTILVLRVTTSVTSVGGCAVAYR